MSNNTSSSTAIPGMSYPTQKGMLAGTPGASAIAQGNLSTQKLVALNKIGGKHGYRKRGGATTPTTITVPQFNVQYTPQGGPGQDPNSIIKQNAAIGTQGAANAVYDRYATQVGGVYMNTNTNKYEWGCYSGGKKGKKTKKTKKTEKRRKINKKKRTTTKRRTMRTKNKTR